MEISEQWVHIDSAHLNRFPRGSCYWIPFRVISTSKGDYLLNEFLLSHLRDITHIAALLRPVPSQLIDYEPVSLPYLLPSKMLTEEELRSLLLRSVEEIRNRLSALSLSVREMINILKGKSDSFRKSAERADLRVALQLLTKKLAVEKGFSIEGRIYLAYSFVRGEILLVDTGERDRAFEILSKRDTGIKEALKGIFKGKDGVDRSG